MWRDRIDKVQAKKAQTEAGASLFDNELVGRGQNISGAGASPERR
jgi:hypothetical protein